MANLKAETVELIKQIYKKYPSGGALHIVLDDDNVEDSDILWCLKNLIPDEELCKAEDRTLFKQCATNLLELGTERKRWNCIAKAFDDMRKEDGKKDNTCCGCVYENIDDTTEDISKCVCCKRNVDYAKNDYYMRKEDEGK